MSVIRDVRDLRPDDRRSLERVLGRPLNDDERIVIEVTEREGRTASAGAPSREIASPLPEWRDVYAGMSDQEIADVEEAILRSPGGRRIE